MGRKALKAVAVPAGVAALAFLASVLLPGERMNGWQRSMDLRSGRERYQRYFLGMTIADRTEETDLSRLYAHFVGPAPEPHWVNVLSRWFCVLSPRIQYVYGSCWQTGRRLAKCLNEGPFTDGARRACVTEFLRLAQTEDGAHQAERYADAVLLLAAERPERMQRPIEAADLPQQPRRTTDYSPPLIHTAQR